MSDSLTILYLDLNHWIELSKARLGRPTSRAPYREIYPVLQRLVHTGKVVTPLSEVHYAEMRDRIRSFDQRNELAITMTELSQYTALPPRDHVLPRQLRAAIAAHFGMTARESGQEQPTLGHGAGYAQRAKPLDGRLVGSPTPAPDPAEMLVHALQEMEMRIGGGWRYSAREHLAGQDWQSSLTALFNEAAEFSILRGPRPSEIEEVRALGYRPEDLVQLMIDVTEREQRMKAVLIAKPAGERRPDDVTGAAALALGNGPHHVANALRDLGIPYTVWGDLGKADLSAIVADTPVLDIERSLRLGRLKNGDYRITGNDLYDMAALGVAVACCDAVATDNSARHMLISADMHNRHHCTIVSKASDLLAAVAAIDA